MNDTTASPDTLMLGIDTGGTYTDAVLYSERSGVVAKAKALTTRHDLAEGIAGAVDAVLARAAARPGAIGLVSMSTTLATNALVEGQGGRVALVMVGFSPADLDRAGLRGALGSDPVLFLPGGHDVHGNETPLELGDLERQVEALARDVTAFAVCAYFAVRNPAHEIAVRDLIRAATGLPVTASHELSAQLGGPRRALTTLLNARLVSLIDRLVAATETFLETRGIAAPLMVVRGDGALVSAAFARARPIETILSGPAASLVGARHLTGLANALVSDIGGTTTDIAVLQDGHPRIDPEGASVGGHRTMVEAVAMRTFGLGGDSEVALEEGTLQPRILLGPRRLVPLSLAAHLHGDTIVETLERQLGRPLVGRQDGRFACLSGVPQQYAAGLTSGEQALYERLERIPQPLESLLVSNAQIATLGRLVSRGLALLVGFTPSDAAHVLGRQSGWNAEAAQCGAALFARRRDGNGDALAPSAEALSVQVLACLTRRSAEVLLETALCEDGLDGGALALHPLVRHALDDTQGLVRLDIALDRPIIGLGASAPLHYAALSGLFGQECILPEHADVANAIGAVVGQVRVRVEAHIGQPREGVFRASTTGAMRDFQDEEEAISFAEDVLRTEARMRAVAAGAHEAELRVARDVRAVDADGRRNFVEAFVIVEATGRPRVARHRDA
ncbi:hydantoinase/oxoprolinase family protein [Nitratireductor soli]|uniref:hydantoinase/oxoprolinase family protein n=1 Tax=Nitratireductor soli TaxID=1670619 RepID=UPI00065E1353|nr:hydantoinase/oxoprolinase family protein [Nitratireductor soli]